MSNERDSVRFADHWFTAPELLALLDAVADGIVTQDSTGKLIYVNPAAARFVGYNSPEEMVRAAPSRVVDLYDLLDEYGRPLPVERFQSETRSAFTFAFRMGTIADWLVRMVTGWVRRYSNRSPRSCAAAAEG